MQRRHPHLWCDEGAGALAADAAVLQADLQGALVHRLAFLVVVVPLWLQAGHLLYHHLEGTFCQPGGEAERVEGGEKVRKEESKERRFRELGYRREGQRSERGG